MVKVKTDKAYSTITQKSQCILCYSKHDHAVNLCIFCAKRIQDINQPNASQEDQAIITCLKIGKSRERSKKYRSLANALLRLDNSLVLENAGLRYKINQVMVQNRRLELKQQTPMVFSKKISQQSQTQSSVTGLGKKKIQIFKTKRQITKKNEKTAFIKLQAQKDKFKLGQLLKSDDFRGSFENIVDIAIKNSTPKQRKDQYEPLSKPFCDGIEVDLGTFTKEETLRTKNQLLNDIHRHVEGWTIVNLLYSNRQHKTYLWITLAPGCTEIQNTFVQKVFNLLRTLKEHARKFWGKLGSKGPEVQLSKIDVTQDFLGSFLPNRNAQLSQNYRDELQKVISDLHQQPTKAFFQTPDGREPIVHKCYSKLSTCSKFEVKTPQQSKLMAVKVYDKNLDLFSRDGCLMVGSRCRKVLGSTMAVNSFQERLRRASDTGMTRVEVSLFLNLENGYRFYGPKSRALFQTRVNQMFGTIAENVLNLQKNLRLTYKSLDVTDLLDGISQIKNNALIVGDNNVYLVVAATDLSNNFVGTKYTINMKGHLETEDHWKRLKAFVSRYATPGSQTKVYYLHQPSLDTPSIVPILKDENALFQPPGCSMECQNGILLPKMVTTPIPQQELLSYLKMDWEGFRKALTTLIRANDDKKHKLTRNKTVKALKKTKR